METKEVKFAEISVEKTKEEGKKEKENIDDFMEKVNKPYPNCTICKDKINKVTQYNGVIEEKYQHNRYLECNHFIMCFNEKDIQSLNL